MILDDEIADVFFWRKMIGASASLGIVVRMWSGLADVAPNPPRHVLTSRILNIAAVASMHGSLKSKLFGGCSTATKAPRVTASDCNHDLNITQELKYNNQSEFEARRLIEVILRCPTVRLHIEFITGT